MTRRPADIPAEDWAGGLASSFERLERAWLRLYCAAVPREIRRHFLWTAGWGPVGAMLFLMIGFTARLLTRFGPVGSDVGSDPA